MNDEPLTEKPESLDLDSQDEELITKNLYWDQQVSVTLNGIRSEYMEVKQGVHV